VRILLVIYDDQSNVSIFPMGLAYIAAVLEERGYEVEVYNQDLHHYPDEHLTKYLEDNTFDVVCVSVIAGYYQYRKLLSISQAINRSSNRPFYIIGGYGPTPEPGYFMKKTGADVIVMGEGEETAVHLFKAIDSGTTLENIKGIAYNQNGFCKVNERRPLIEAIDSIPWPAYHKFPMEIYRLYKLPGMGPTDFSIPMMSGRGCTFKCTFCYRMDTGFRARDSENILEEVTYLHKTFGITRISFQDDLLMTSVDRTEQLCAAFEKANLPVKWDCNGRLNYAKPDLLKYMKKTGCVYVNYGIESMDKNVLNKMKKGLSPEMIVKGVENTLAVGLNPGLNFLFGSVGDTKETLEKTIEFLLKYDNFIERRTLRPVTPYPGSPLYHYAIEKGLLEGIDDFYENKHLNSDLVAVNFTEMSDQELYDCLKDANQRLMENYYNHQKESVMNQIADLYDTKDVAFRGFRHAV